MYFKISTFYFMKHNLKTLVKLRGLLRPAVLEFRYVTLHTKYCVCALLLTRPGHPNRITELFLLCVGGIELIDLDLNHRSSTASSLLAQVTPT